MRPCFVEAYREGDRFGKIRELNIWVLGANARA
jgi:hypothetical protein